MLFLHLTIPTRLTPICFFLLLMGLMACEDEAGLTLEEQRAREDLIITTYLTENNITNFQRTESGLYMVPLEPGDGVSGGANGLASIRFEGRVLYGKRFESNLNATEPFKVQMPSGRPLEGFDEEGEPVFSERRIIQGKIQAVSMMRVGQRARFFIPSHLAYGTSGAPSPQGTPSLVPGNTVVVFEIFLENFEI